MADQSTEKLLLERILDQGVQNTNFFNGRLLTAKDLQDEQNANRRQHQQLGQVLGEGVVRGLEVTLVANGSNGKPPVVAVSNGLAINRAGQVIELPVDLPQLAFARQSATTAVDAKLFQLCQPPDRGFSPAEGIYLLVICPTSGYQESVPRRGFGDNGKVDGCGRRYAIEGVQFRLEKLDMTTLNQISQSTRDEIAALTAKTDPASLSKLRNWLAHLCFGTEELTGFLRDPFRRVTNSGQSQSPYLTYGAIDALRTKSGQLTDCDIPLALVYWPKAGVQFVDMWAVRRRPKPQPFPTAWPLPLSEQRLAESEAAFYQFQEHVAYLTRPAVAQLQLATVKAIDHFRFLPPAGVIPLGGIHSSRGFDPRTFFQGLTARNPVFNPIIIGRARADPLVIEGAKVEALLRNSLSFPPIDLRSQELIWLYLVRENKYLIDHSSTNLPQPYMIFTSGHAPYQGDARFDAVRYDYSNFALR